MLIDLTGLPWPVLALTAGVSTRLVRRLLFPDRGRRLPKLPRDSALRLLLLDDSRLAQLQETWVPADQVGQQLQSLLDAGYPAADLARYCRLSVTELLATSTAARCTEQTALLVRAAALEARPADGHR